MKNCEINEQEETNMMNDNAMYMPVAPVGYGNDGGMFGGNSAWLIIVLLALFGWGNNGWGGNNNTNADIQHGPEERRW